MKNTFIKTNDGGYYEIAEKVSAMSSLVTIASELVEISEHLTLEEIHKMFLRIIAGADEGKDSISLMFRLKMRARRN